MVENVAQAFHRKINLLEVLPDLGQAKHRTRHIASNHSEGDQPAHGEVALNH